MKDAIDAVSYDDCTKQDWDELHVAIKQNTTNKNNMKIKKSLAIIKKDTVVKNKKRSEALKERAFPLWKVLESFRKLLTSGRLRSD